MITFKLYSKNNPNGEILAKVKGEIHIHFLRDFYSKIYPLDKGFKVTYKLPYKKEVMLY